MHEREWVELGKLDYFLEHLARAVERGEVPLASYQALAPRYLERRAELTSVLTRAGAGSAVAPQPASVQQPLPQSLPVAPPAAAQPLQGSLPATPPTAAQALPVTPAVSKPPMSWTTILIATGAFLVIVAAAVFAVAAWQLVSPGLRFLFLGALTLGFYVAGERVRTRLGLGTAGIALTVVASAMLLFDGWILIDGYSLSGPLPFAGWFLLCSVVYWLSEVRLGGGFFGITGAAAQVAWWWLLGEGIGLSSAPRLAAIALVLLVWAVLAVRVSEDSEFARLARILKAAAPVGILIVVWSFITTYSSGPVTLEDLFAAAIVGFSATMIVDALGFNPGIGAAGHLPVMLLASVGPLDAWSYVAFFSAISVPYVAHELRRGGVGHGVLGLLSMVAAAFALTDVLDWSASSLVAVLTALALVWSFAAVRMRALRIAEEYRAARVFAMSLVLEFGGWLLLAAASLALPFAADAIPVLGGAATFGDAALIAFVAVAVFLASVMHRRPAVVASMVISLYALWAVLGAAGIAAGAPLRATALILLAGAWAASAGWIERLTGLEQVVTRILMRGCVGILVFAALVVDGMFAGLPSWQSAAVLAVSAGWFLLDGVLARSRGSLAAASALVVGAVAMWAGWRFDGPEAAVAVSVAALAVCAAGGIARRVRGAGDLAPWAATATATLIAVFAWSDAGLLGIALAVTGLAAFSAAYTSRWYEGALIAGVLLGGSVLAALAEFSALPWVTVGVVAAYAAIQLMPSFAIGGESASPSGRIVRALAASGLVSLLTLVLLGLYSNSAFFAVPGWAALDGHALAAAVALTGAYILAASVRFELDPGMYAGVGVLLVAYWIELAEGSVSAIEWYSIPAAVYVAWCGYRWSWKASGRAVPFVTDLGATLILLAPSALAMLNPYAEPSVSWAHTFWALGLAIAVIAAGVLLRVRVYLFGGVVALVWTALVRSWTYLVEYWWIVLGLVGIGMIAVAVTRELRRQVLSGVRDVLEGWR